MYQYLKLLQPAAEQIGEICEVRVYRQGTYTDAQIRISGTVRAGHSFKLELTVKEGSADDRN